MGPTRRSLRVTLSYVLDWIAIILIAIVGGLLTLIKPNHRAFSLADPSISYPYLEHETVSVATLGLVALLAPAVITLVISLVFVPGRSISKGIPKGRLWRRKLWEWNTAWLGLGLACALAFFITDGMKILFGMPRPDLIARCNPDLTAIAQNTVGGLGTKVFEGQFLVDYHICQQTDNGVLSDGFMSFPSGHASFSWAGLGYLSLFVCAKFAIAIPYLLPSKYGTAFDAAELTTGDGNGTPSPDRQLMTLRSAAAGPPVYLVVLALIPLCVATFITATRFTDYYHHAFDLIVGTLIGITCAWVGFRWFHAPIRRGAGWSWGPRSSSKAFGIGVGVQSYGEHGDDLESDKGQERRQDLESGPPETEPVAE